MVWRGVSILPTFAHSLPTLCLIHLLTLYHRVSLLHDPGFTGNFCSSLSVIASRIGGTGIPRRASQMGKISQIVGSSSVALGQAILIREGVKETDVKG